ncbi:Atu4866 domain-containing protein [Asticcacaulis machinosus]|uniref:Atu4866 domain-containing protein n=1 Tax=Asticcacaulis machinosus TaxID=2984211 RepID=A0ABT5HH69_9CAUL|nr:Atu4866 domain-containing protein [Asticcacaulis machinosus]MDC7675537.1 Atu4866 domain-containing protein [Asticcacaulis machinosus]
MSKFIKIAGLIMGLLMVTGAVSMTLPPQPPTPNDTKQKEDKMQPHPYIGMWVTGDGRIRQELLPNGRYDEARGARKSAYQGRYEVSGNRINYWDDTGFTADGIFVDTNTLEHGGMVFYREN